MWYYSVILSSWLVMALLFDLLIGDDPEGSFWGIVIYAPIAVWLFISREK